MNHLKISLLLALLVTGIFSCKKDDPASTPALAIVSIYEGKYGTGNNDPSAYFSFNVKADGTLEELNSVGAVIGTGTWSISGSIFQGTYQYLPPFTSSFKVSAQYEASTKKLTGTWGYGTSNSDGGKWYMNKK